MISGICKPISMLISYIYVPIALNYLGVEKYGIWATLLTILGWIGYFDIGIGNGLRNKLTESLSKRDGQAKRLVSSAYAIIALIMIASAIVLSFVASTVNWNRIFKVESSDENLAGLVVLTLLFVCINFVLTICKNVLYALQKAANISLMELSIQIINLFGILILSSVKEGSLFGMAVIYGGSMISVNIIASAIIYTKHKDLSPNLSSVDFSVGKKIASLGAQFFVIQVCALVLFSTDSLIISYLYGATDVTPYNMVQKLFNVIIGIYSAFIAPIWSNVTQLKTQNRPNDIRNIINKLHKIMFPFALMAIVLAMVFRTVSFIWLGRDLEYSNALIIFGCMYALLTIWCNTYAAISNGMEIMKISMVFACVQAIVNIPLSLFMAETLNLKTAGVLGGTVGAMCIAAIVSPIIINCYLRKMDALSEQGDYQQ